MIQHGETLFILANAEGIDALSNFFYTPTCVLQEVTGKLSGVKTVEWVRISNDGQVQECEASRFPDWMRVAVAIVLFLPATIIYACLSVFIRSFRRNKVSYCQGLLKVEASIKSEKKINTVVSNKLTSFLNSEEWKEVAKLKTMRMGEQDIPVELVKKIIYSTLKDNFADYPAVRFVCRRFHLLTTENDLWRELIPLPISFEENQEKGLFLYKRVVPKIHTIRELFDDSETFEKLPLIEIPIGVSDRENISTSFLKVHLVRNNISEILGHLNYGRFYCMNGLYGLFYKCQTIGNQTNESYLIAYKIKGAWQVLINTTTLEFVDSSAEDGLRNFIKGQSCLLKNSTGAVTAQRNDAHLSNNTDDTVL